MGLALGAGAWLAQPLCANEAINPTLDVQDLRVVVSYVSKAELVQLQRLERTWNPHGLGLLRWDRTSTPLGESAIEFVIRKRV